MTSAILIVAVFVVLMLCRFAFAVLHSRPLLRDIAAPYQRCKSASELGLLMLEQPCADVIAENPFGAFSDRIYLIGGSSRADASVAVAPVLAGQLGDHFSQRIFISPLHRPIALRGTPLTN